jgi:hypothetical protein
MLINSANNFKLEIKYPNIERIKLLAKNNKNYRSYLKNVFLKVSPPKQSDNITSFCETLLGIYPNVALDSNSNEYKIIIQGFLPKKFTFKHAEQLKIGDMIVAINDIMINSANIEDVLKAVKTPKSLKITALVPITYVNLNTNDLLNNKFISHKSEISNLAKEKPTCTKVVANSKCTQVLQGDRVKCPTENLLDDFFYFIMILSMNNHNFMRDKEKMVGILFNYSFKFIVKVSEFQLNLNFT